MKFINLKLKQLTKKRDAERIIKFLIGPNAFHWELSEGERKSIRERVTHAISATKQNRYWFYENEEGEIIGAGGVERLQDTTGGFFLGWFAVHKNYRRQGLGRNIVKKVEKYVRSLKGRFMTIDTGVDNEANLFYQKIGYKKVGLIPEYFEDKVGKLIYYKKLGK